ncbi:flagellar biosynthesis repressor FlbT [Tardiphaga sp. vice154]|uniref:flagellar biosynthesis repressor FlbT n=1 Tax=Tardiphaga sp. vice154 TaxID=2592814 RepID=UPI00143DF0DB|nr:flagellar biosynthesis repressor FlbT [Tardiphaga sp. vice154]
MPLKMTLEPQEWFMVGDTKVVNIWNEKAKLRIDGAAPILRQAHTMSEQDTDTPAKRVYLAVQLLYLGMTSNPEKYFILVESLLKENPAAGDTVRKANEQVAAGSYYGALREYRKIIEPRTALDIGG